jgi:hypothetical protein
MSLFAWIKRRLERVAKATHRQMESTLDTNRELHGLLAFVLAIARYVIGGVCINLLVTPLLLHHFPNAGRDMQVYRITLSLGYDNVSRKQ